MKFHLTPKKGDYYIELEEDVLQAWCKQLFIHKRNMRVGKELLIILALNREMTAREYCEKHLNIRVHTKMEGILREVDATRAQYLE